jgi:chromate transporter
MPGRAYGTRRSIRVAVVWLVLWLTSRRVLLVAFGSNDVFSQIAVFFSKMAMVTFGGAYAVLAYVAQQAVDHYALAEAARDARRSWHGRNHAWSVDHGAAIRGLHGRLPRSPADVVAAAGGHAWWIARDLGHLCAVLSLDFPRGAVRRTLFVATRRSSAALAAITAAVVGVILNLAIWFAIHTMFREVKPVRTLGLSFDMPVLQSVNGWAVALSVAALLGVFYLRIGLLQILLACAGAGVLLHIVGLV